MAARVRIDCNRLPARTPRQLIAVNSASAAAATNESCNGQLRQLEKIAREGHRDRCHPTGLDDEEQNPPVDERNRRVQSLAQIGILPADNRQPRGQLRINETSGERDHPASRPTPRG